MLFFSENAGLDWGENILCGLHMLKTGTNRDKLGWGWLLEKDDDMAALLPVVKEVESCQSPVFLLPLLQNKQVWYQCQEKYCLNMAPAFQDFDFSAVCRIS